MNTLSLWLYIMIGAGIATANPYKDLPVSERVGIIVAWPALIIRDFINVMEDRA